LRNPLCLVTVGPCPGTHLVVGKAEEVAGLLNRSEARPAPPDGITSRFARTGQG